MNTSPFHPGDKVVAYCRYSEGDEQGLKNQSTEEQADAIRAFCDQNGLTLTRVFADPFASGRSVAKRDHYLEMLSYLLHKKKPDVQGVVLWDFERYGRNFDQAQLDAARLRMAGYKLFSLQQPIADDSPFAHVLEAMYFASAQNQSDMISADVKRALQNNFLKYKVIPRSCIGWGWIPSPVDMGVYSDGTQRIGYRAVPDPSKVELIRAAVKARLRGMSLTQCREILGLKANEDVKRLFRRPQLYGAFAYGGTTIEDYCDPIISKEQFEALRLFEEANSRKQIGRQGGWSADPPMLSGLLYCAECGGPMYIYRRKSRGHLYCSYYCEKSCFPGVKQDKLEKLVVDLCGEILTSENVKKWVGMLSDFHKSEAAKERVESLERDLAVLNRKIDAAVTLLLDTPSEALAKKLKELESKQKAIQGKLDMLSGRAAEPLSEEDLYNSTLDLTARIMAVLRSQDASADLKRTALGFFIRSIVVNRNGDVILNYLPPGFSPIVVGGTESAPPRIKQKYEEVVGEPPRKSPAPPEGAVFRLQHFGRL